MKKRIKSLKEQVLVITGASSGIGLATAQLAATRGARVRLISRNSEQLDKIVKEINDSGGKAFAASADVGNYKELKSARDKIVKHYGHIDCWINNAGVSIFSKLLDLDLNEEQQIFETNFWGVRNGCHLAVETFGTHYGTIINVGSSVSARATPLQSIYSATKHAVKAYNDALRIELKKDKRNIAVCLIRPTAMNTPFAQHALNKLEKGTPKLPEPCYDPTLSAEAILKCAESPQRDVFVGARSKVGALIELLAPSRADDKAVKNFDKQIGNFPHKRSQEGLFSHPKKEGLIRGDYKETDEIKTSVYTYLSTHKIESIVSLLTLLTGAYKFFKK